MIEYIITQLFLKIMKIKDSKDSKVRVKREQASLDPPYNYQKAPIHLPEPRTERKEIKFNHSL